jgi:hypothetical protein
MILPACSKRRRVVSGYAGVLALVVLMWLPSDKLGELADFKFSLVVGVLFGVLMAVINILGLFHIVS